MTSRIRLNLGCGNEYRPGFINIDNQSKVIDVKANVLSLPFKANSIDRIVASQLLEHFDYVHCKYLLSEWFISLRPKGELVLEIPDLKKSYKKLISANKEDKEKQLQWIYGIDSPGMQHGTGFTYEMLKTLLKEVGFSNIKEKDQKTYTYEPGIRVTCKKPKGCKNANFFANFRRNLFRKMKVDSFVLIPIEDWIGNIKEWIKQKKDINDIIAESAICNPRIPLAFLETFKEISDKDFKDRIEYVNYLKNIDLHKRIFTLWMKSKKSKDIESDYDRFISNQKEMIKVSLKDKNELSYIEHQKAYSTDIFDLKIILTEAKKKYSLGVKRFEKKDFEKALRYFTESVKLNYINPMTHWNLARLKCLLGKSKNSIENEYKFALRTVENSMILNRVKKEYKHYEEKFSVPQKPVPWTPYNLNMC